MRAYQASVGLPETGAPDRATPCGKLLGSTIESGPDALFCSGTLCRLRRGSSVSSTLQRAHRRRYPGEFRRIIVLGSPPHCADVASSASRARRSLLCVRIWRRWPAGRREFYGQLPLGFSCPWPSANSCSVRYSALQPIRLGLGPPRRRAGSRVASFFLQAPRHRTHPFSVSPGGGRSGRPAPGDQSDLSKNASSLPTRLVPANEQDRLARSGSNAKAMRQNAPIGGRCSGQLLHVGILRPGQGCFAWGPPDHRDLPARANQRPGRGSRLHLLWRGPSISGSNSSAKGYGSTCIGQILPLKLY